VLLNVSDRSIALPGDVDLTTIGQYRPDGNKRDVDILALTTDKASIRSIEQAAKRTIGDELELSVFGMHRLARLRQQQAHPLRTLGRIWLADRYVTEEAGEITALTKALYPFAVDVPLETLETWQLTVGNGDPMPVPHPGTVILNYLTRSVSGLRPKDAAKVDALTANVLSKAPELAAWIQDGPGHSQIELARILQTLRRGFGAEPLIVGDKITVTPYSLRELARHPGQLEGRRPALAAVARFVSRAKARGLHSIESQRRVVTFFQRYVERHAGGVITNH
jgi:hypothetical protein